MRRSGSTWLTCRWARGGGLGDVFLSGAVYVCIPVEWVWGRKVWGKGERRRGVLVSVHVDSMTQHVEYCLSMLIHGVNLVSWRGPPHIQSHRRVLPASWQPTTCSFKD